MYSHVRRRTRQFRIQRVTLLYRVAHQFRWVVSLDDWYKIQIIRTVVFCRYYWIQSTQQRQCNNGFVQDAAVAVTFSASDEFSEWPPAVRRIHVDCIVFVASSSESASLRYVVFFPRTFVDYHSFGACRCVNTYGCWTRCGRDGGNTNEKRLYGRQQRFRGYGGGWHFVFRASIPRRYILQYRTGAFAKYAAEKDYNWLAACLSSTLQKQRWNIRLTHAILFVKKKKTKTKWRSGDWYFVRPILSFVSFQRIQRMKI